MNAKLVGFSSDREAKMTLQDAIFDNAAMAMLTGNEIKTAPGVVQLYEDVLFDSSNKTTLQNAPIAGNSEQPIQIFKLVGNSLGEKITTPPTVTNKKITVAGTAGIKARVYYFYTTPADSQTIKVTSDLFGGTFRVVADVLVRDEETKKDFYGQFIVPNAKIEDSFSFNFSPDGDPSVMDIPLEILKDPYSTDMWQFVIYGDDDIEGIKITFDAQGGSPVESIILANPGMSIAELPITAHPSWIFEGWYNDPIAGTKVTEGVTVFNNHTTLYAQWDKD